MSERAEQLLSVLRQFDETDRIEAKRASEIGESLLETVCAFANEPDLGGGWILLGVEKVSYSPGDYKVVGIEDQDRLLNDLHSKCATEFNIPIRIQAQTELLEGKTVIVVFIPECEPSSKPLYFAKKPLPRAAWRRGPNGDYRCNQDDLSLLFQSRSGYSFDSSPLIYASLEDLNADSVTEYRQARLAVNAGAEELDFSNNELLEALSSITRKDNSIYPTVAGILLFGHRAALRRLFPAMRVDYIRVPGREWIEDPENRFTTLEMRDTLPRLVQRASASVLDDLPRAFQLPEGGLRRGEQPLLPAKVVREAIVNALMHRNYKRQEPIQIIRYSNRLEIRNPGYSLKSVEQLGEPGTEWRNPNIASVLHEMGYAETKGSGIRVMRSLMEREGLSPPSFESDRHNDFFAATYLFHHFLSEEDVHWLGQFQHLGLREEEKRALVYVRESGRITNSEYRDLNKTDTLTASQHLTHLRDLNLLRQEPKGAATFYEPGPKLVWPEEKITKTDKANATFEYSGKRRFLPGLSGESPGLSGESPGLSGESQFLSRESLLDSLPEELQHKISRLGQRSRDTSKVRDVILSLCEIRPFTSEELANLLGRNKNYLQNQYLNKLLRENRLAYYYPYEPNRPDQAYVTQKK